MLLFVGKKEKGFLLKKPEKRLNILTRHYISKTRQKQY